MQKVLKPKKKPKEKFIQVWVEVKKNGKGTDVFDINPKLKPKIN